MLFGDLRLLSADLGKLILATESLALLHYVVNSGIVSAVNALRLGKNLIRTWHEAFLWTSISYFAGAIAAALVVTLIKFISIYAFIIAIPILAITYLTYKNYLANVQSSINHAEQMADLHLRTIEALAIAIDAKDEVTHDHVHRVQVYATGLARLFGLRDEEIEALKAGALLHDIGKLAVPDYILNKPGRLTPAEFERMRLPVSSRARGPPSSRTLGRHRVPGQASQGRDPDDRSDPYGFRLLRCSAGRPTVPEGYDPR
jgi:hypothetical protein